MRIALATDAWFPQVNGVVRTLAATVAELDRRGYEVELITPARFLTVPMPGYDAIRLAVAPRFGARRILNQFKPDIVHIATEGPIGWSARSWCMAHRVPFTSAFHTRFPDYAAVRTGLKAERFWPVMRRFHAPSRAVLAATQTLSEELGARGIERVRPWSRGIDRWLFRPDHAPHSAMVDLPRPILLNVGRVSVEKNLEAFLDLDCPGSKVVIGDGPDRARLEAAYPSAIFLGSLAGEELASAYCAADCFVFPSRTDTFGLVVIEALACGLPVAAYPVAGPLDIVGANGRGPTNVFAATIGVLEKNLAEAVSRALRLDRVAAAVYGARFSWDAATDQFIAALENALERPRESLPEAVTDKPELTLA